MNSQNSTTGKLSIRTMSYPMPDKTPFKLKCLLMVPPILFLLATASVNFSRAAVEPILFEEANATAYFALINVIAQIGGTIIQPIGGKFGDLYGRKRVALIMIIPFILSIVGVSLSTTPLMIGIAFFALGITGQILAPLANGMVIDAFQVKDRTRLLTLMNAVDALAGMLGPILVGNFSDSYGAQTTFLCLTVLAAIAFVAILLIYPDIRTEKAENARIDVKGIILLFFTVAPVCMALSLADTYIPWSSPWLYVMFGATVVFFIFFARYEKKQTQPIVSFEMLKVRGFWLILMPLVMHMFVSVCTPYFNMYARQVMGYTGTELGVMSTLVIISVICNVPIGIWLSRDPTGKRFRTCLTISAVSMLCAALCYKFVVRPDAPLWQMCISRGFFYVTSCFSLAPVNAYLGICLPANKRGMGLGINMFLSSLAGALMSAVYALIVNMTGGTVETAWPVITTVALCGAVLRLVLSVFIKNPYDMAKDMENITH